MVFPVSYQSPKHTLSTYTHTYAHTHTPWLLFRYSVARSSDTTAPVAEAPTTAEPEAAQALPMGKAATSKEVRPAVNTVPKPSAASIEEETVSAEAGSSCSAQVHAPHTLSPAAVHHVPGPSRVSEV